MMLYWNEERKLGKTKKTKANWLELDHVALSLIFYWMGLFGFKCFVPPPNNGFIPDGIPNNIISMIYLLTEVCCGIILYDFIFFFIHWGLHELPALKSFHQKHHRHVRGIVEATDVLNHSFIDGALQVLVNIYAQRYTPWGIAKSRLARLLHNVIVTWMLTESHSSSSNLYCFRRWFVGVKNHRLHHIGYYGKQQRNRNHAFTLTHYQQFFGYLDATLYKYRIFCQNLRSTKSILTSDEKYS